MLLENYPQIKKAASTAEHHLPASADHYEYYLYSQLNLLTTYPGVKGLKDGYTPEAGWCLITYYEKDDVELIGIVLGSEDRRGEMQTLLDYSLTKAGYNSPSTFIISKTKVSKVKIEPVEPLLLLQFLWELVLMLEQYLQLLEILLLLLLALKCPYITSFYKEYSFVVRFETIFCKKTVIEMLIVGLDVR